MNSYMNRQMRHMRLCELVALKEMGASFMMNGFVVEGNQEESPLEDFFTKHGIAPEKIDDTRSVDQIGWSEKEQKWYGWSHRAIYGFGIGSKSGKGKVGYQTLIDNGWPTEANTKDDCKKMAIAFAEEID